MIKAGCSGFPCVQDTYFRRFPVIEVQHTFYQPPRLATLERWRAKAPDGFEFALKAWQVITHPVRAPTYRRMREQLRRPDDAGFFQPNETVFAAWDRTRQAARALHASLVLFQCPASFTPTPSHIADMRAFFRVIPRENLALAWEPRGAWTDSLIAELCRDLDLHHCVDPFERASVTARIAYFRLHGIGGYRYRYTDADLARLHRSCAAHTQVFCFFNNMTMFRDAERFQALVEGTGRDGPE